MFANSQQINENTFNLESGMKIYGGLSTFQLQAPPKLSKDANTLKLLPRIRKIYSTYPQPLEYVTIGISRQEPTIPSQLGILIGFFETSLMVYQLPATKPMSPNAIDLSTRVMTDPNPVVTQFPNPSSESPGYLTCFIQKKFDSKKKTLMCVITDGTQIYQFDFVDDGSERDWTDLQIENGMKGSEFYLIGSGRRTVEVMYLVIDSFNQKISIEKSDVLKDCQSPASITANFSMVYVYCMQYKNSKFQINGYSYQRF